MERFYKRKRVVLHCEVVTPMFLGGANQEAEWRSAPFKALLRQWWRVTQHRVGGADALAKEEGSLFGCAGEEGASGKSLVWVGVESDAKLSTTPLPPCPTVHHPECERNQNISPLLYLAGMGLVNPQLQVKHSYFMPEARFQLLVDYPRNREQAITPVLALIQAFGAVGARSRNGWGSFRVVEMIENGQKRPVDTTAMERFLASAPITEQWTAGMKKDYPNSLGKDENNLLLWKTRSQKEWKLAMRDLAEAYIAVRAKDMGKDGRLNPGARNNDRIQERHLLGIPLTNHNYGRGDSRHASPLRFVVRRFADGYKGFILHVPHGHSSKQPLAPGVNPLQTWEKVHRKLDGLPAILSRATYGEVLA